MKLSNKTTNYGVTSADWNFINDSKTSSDTSFFSFKCPLLVIYLVILFCFWSIGGPGFLIKGSISKVSLV